MKFNLIDKYNHIIISMRCDIVIFPCIFWMSLCIRNNVETKLRKELVPGEHADILAESNLMV